MVVQRHASTFLYEKEHKSVVFWVETVDGHPVKVSLKVVRTLELAIDTEALRCDRIHFIDHTLASWVCYCPVQKWSVTRAIFRFKAEFLHWSDKLFHKIFQFNFIIILSLT